MRWRHFESAVVFLDMLNKKIVSIERMHGLGMVMMGDVDWTAGKLRDLVSVVMLR